MTHNKNDSKCGPGAALLLPRTVDVAVTSGHRLCLHLWALPSPTPKVENPRQRGPSGSRFPALTCSQMLKKAICISILSSGSYVEVTPKSPGGPENAGSPRHSSRERVGPGARALRQGQSPSCPRAGAHFLSPAAEGQSPRGLVAPTSVLLPPSPQSSDGGSGGLGGTYRSGWHPGTRSRPIPPAG